MLFLYLFALLGSTAENVVFNVMDCGAKGTGIDDDTAAIWNCLHKAKTMVSRKTVLFPSGFTFLTSPFNLSSATILQVDGTILGIANQEKWEIIPPLPSYGKSRDAGSMRYQALIMAGEGPEVDCSDIRITGEGIIDGNGQYWWDIKQKRSNETLHAGRGHLIETYFCDNVEIDSVTLKDSPFWTLHPVYSTNIHIHHINITAPLYAPNVDGVDPDSSKHVLIEHCNIACGDDHVAVKSGMNLPGITFNMSSENITVRYNTLGRGMGLTIGSETSGGIRGIHFHDNSQIGGGWNIGNHIKTGMNRGNVIEDVVFENNRMINNTYTMNIATNYDNGKHSYPDTRIRNITFRGLNVNGTNLGGAFTCNQNSTCDGVVVENNVLTNYHKNWGCHWISSYTVSDNTDESTLEKCMAGSMHLSAQTRPKQEAVPDVPEQCLPLSGDLREKCVEYIEWNYTPQL